MALDTREAALCIRHRHYLAMKAVLDDSTSRCNPQVYSVAEVAIVEVDSNWKKYCASVEALSPDMKPVWIMVDLDLVIIVEIMAEEGDVEAVLHPMH